MGVERNFILMYGWQFDRDSVEDAFKDTLEFDEDPYQYFLSLGLEYYDSHYSREDPDYIGIPIVKFYEWSDETPVSFDTINMKTLVCELYEKRDIWTEEFKKLIENINPQIHCFVYYT